MAVTLVFAHRGAAHRAPENSVVAFLEAHRLGADGVELDVRRSSDGALVVHHDSSVPGLGPIAELTVAQLPDHVPLLDAALDACAGMRVNIEIKNEAPSASSEAPDALALAVVRTALEVRAREELLISSFDLATLDAVRVADPDLEVGWLLDLTEDPRAALDVALGRGFSALHPFVLSVTAELVEVAHSSGLAINTWTVNARHDLEAMVALGVDVVITDDVPLARSVADRR